MKHRNKVIIINVISFVIYFGVSTLLEAFTTLQFMGASIIAFIAAIIVHEILLIKNRSPPESEPAASDLNERMDEGTS